MSGPKSDTWMPFYVGDYLSATGRLTTEQHGAYLLILLDYWKNGPPPNDDVVLAQLARLSTAAWRKAKPALLGFFEVKDEHLIQKRVERERERAVGIVEERSKAGKAGAAKRWQNHGKPIANANGLPLANGQQNDGPSQSHTCSDEQVESPNGDLSAEPTDNPPEYEPPVTAKEIVDAWNMRMVPQGFPKVERVTGTRQKYLKARIRENTLADFQKAMSALEQSAFCRGENRDGWHADFDFFVQSRSFTKLLEGSFAH